MVGKPDIMNKVDVPLKQTTPQLISRSFRSSIQQNTGASSSPLPPSQSNNQLIWIGAAAAIILGGGAYILNSSKDEQSAKPQEVPTKTIPPKKRENK